MASQSKTDPLKMWRDWIDKTERQVNSMMNEVMQSEPFTKTQSRVMESMLGLQNSLNEAAHRYFTTINLPTRTDLLEVNEKIALIEERLARIEGALGTDRVEPPSETPRPRRTKKAPRGDAKTGRSTKKTASKSGSKKAKKKTKKTGRKKTGRKKTGRKKTARKKTVKKASKTAGKKKTSRKKTSKKTSKKA